MHTHPNGPAIGLGDSADGCRSWGVVSLDTTSHDAESVIEVEHLHKGYGTTVAVDDVSFSVRRGEIFGIIGRNGAGKTTTVECLSGLRIPDRGAVNILGYDPRHDRRPLRERVGVQLQESAFPPKIKVDEAVALYRSFYEHPADADQLLRSLGLDDKRDAYFRSLSGGQKQRLSVVLALIGQPEIAILDELTTGLDPEARRETWGLIEGIRDRGVTVVLVTHFMEEAERLCDRVALIDRGRVVALDRPRGLAELASATKRIRLRASSPRHAEVLEALPEVSAVERHGADLVVLGSGNLVAAVVLGLDRAGLVAEDVTTEVTSLDEAFLALTDESTNDTSGAESRR